MEEWYKLWKIQMEVNAKQKILLNMERYNGESPHQFYKYALGFLFMGQNHIFHNIE